eukprot:119899-Amphidinium_carterae.1
MPSGVAGQWWSEFSFAVFNGCRLLEAYQDPPMELCGGVKDAADMDEEFTVGKHRGQLFSQVWDSQPTAETPPLSGPMPLLVSTHLFPSGLVLKFAGQ